MNVNDWTLTVGQVNEYVRKLLSSDPMLRRIRVEGEISGYKRQASGTLYFTLKDEEARIQCVMFRSSAMTMQAPIEDGMKVIVEGAVSLYPQAGIYQLYADSIERQGVGKLYEQFEKLKRRLAEEGLFDEALKREIPLYPKTIGVVTSRTGAVLHDIVKIARRRNPNINVLLAPASVQGNGAAEEIAAAIELLNRDGEADVILCGRGGGSMEDLWCFNEEIVARAIRASKIPVISCVGHETDFTIADFAADLRAATPSAAAELAVPQLGDVRSMLNDAMERSMEALRAKLTQSQSRLALIMASQAMKKPESMMLMRKMKLDELLRRLDTSETKQLNDKKNALALLSRTLQAVSPANVLDRGYSVTMKDGKTVSKKTELGIGDEVSITLSDGSAFAEITRI